MVARGSYWWPDDESMAFMYERGFQWDKEKLCFMYRSGLGVTRRIAQYTNWEVSGQLQWEWVTRRFDRYAQTNVRIGQAGFDSPITAYVNAELAGWE
jgi:hypothetical protein